MEESIVYKDNNYIIETCSKCDLCLNNSFIPGRGQGKRYSYLFFITPNTNNVEYLNGSLSSKRYSKLYKLLIKYNFKFYTTSITKCISKTFLTTHQINTCSQHLINEINIIQPKLIIPIGNITTSLFTNINFEKCKYTITTTNVNGIDYLLYPIDTMSNIRQSDILKIIDKFTIIHKLFNPKYI